MKSSRSWHKRSEVHFIRSPPSSHFTDTSLTQIQIQKQIKIQIQKTEKRSPPHNITTPHCIDFKFIHTSQICSYIKLKHSIILFTSMVHQIHSIVPPYCQQYVAATILQSSAADFLFTPLVRRLTLWAGLPLIFTMIRKILHFYINTPHHQ